MPLACQVADRRMAKKYLVTAPSGGRLRPGLLCIGRTDPAPKNGQLKTEPVLVGSLQVAGIVPPLGTISRVCAVIPGKRQSTLSRYGMIPVTALLSRCIAARTAHHHQAQPQDCLSYPQSCRAVCYHPYCPAARLLCCHIRSGLFARLRSGFSSCHDYRSRSSSAGGCLKISRMAGSAARSAVPTINGREAASAFQFTLYINVQPNDCTFTT